MCGRETRCKYLPRESGHNSTMKAKFRRTDALLFAPILLIGGVGYWQQQRAQKSHEPTRIEVRSLQILPPTPSDVARGFDTRVQLSVGYSGATPRGWGVTEVANSTVPLYGLTGISQNVEPQPNIQTAVAPQRKFVNIDKIEDNFDAKSDVYRGLFRLKLHGISSATPVAVRGSMLSTTMKLPPGRGQHVTWREVKTLSWSAVVRQQGIETPAPPQNFRYSGVKVTKLVRKDAVMGGTRFFHIEVSCAFAPAIAVSEAGKAAFVPHWEDVYLTDAKGRHFRCLMQNWPGNSNSNLPNAKSGAHHEIEFTGWETLPADTSDFTFHASLSVNDFAPLKIDKPIKDIPLIK